MSEPSEKQIEAIKSQFPTRSVHLVELASPSDDSIHFVMSGPNMAEYERFLEEIQRAELIKGDVSEKARALRVVVQNAALAQIRWPERDEARATMDRYPAILPQLAEQLHGSAGASFEVRSKKL